VNTNDASRSLRNPASQIDLSGVRVLRDGRVEPLLHAHPKLSSAAAHWSGVVLEEYIVPACVTPRHEHVEHLLAPSTRADPGLSRLTTRYRPRT
jgi:hypothetical protein